MGENPSDGLEIISIGALYGGGPWEKKYWSCSRGRDRYPYPIGYNAIRTYAGNTYRMEIRQGLKGPLFVITSMEGDSCTGQTPDIAWEHFQKRSGPRVKTWHAKRFSCKIDGVELFGFRNPHVQRLLRELVANINGTAEQSSIHPDFCNDASRLEQELRLPESCTYPDLLMYLGKIQSTRKRSRKQRLTAKCAIGASILKRFRTQELFVDAQVDTAVEESQGHHGGSSPLNISPVCDLPHCHLIRSEKEIDISRSGEMQSDTDMEHNTDEKCMALICPILQNSVVHEDVGALVVSNRTNIAERGNDTSLVKDNLLSKSPKSYGHIVEEHVFPKHQRKLVRTEVLQVRCVADVDLQLEDSSVAAAEGDEMPVLTEFKSMKDTVYCIDDPFDIQDNVAACASEGCMIKPCNVEDKLLAADELSGNSISFDHQIIATNMPTKLKCECQNCSLKCVDALPKNSQDNEVMAFPVISSKDVVLSQQPIVGSHPKETGTAGPSNASSAKSGCDSVGQDFVKAMMTLLLPQALPLLKRTSNQKRVIVKNAVYLKKDPCLNVNGSRSLEKSDGTHHATDIVSEGKLAAAWPIAGSEGDGCGKMDVFDRVPSDPLIKENECNDPLVHCLTNVQRESLGDIKSVIPDSFDDEQCTCDFGKGGSEPLNKSSFDGDSSGFLGAADGNNDSTNCYLGNDGKDKVLDEIVNPSNQPKENDAVLVSGTPFSCTSSCKHILLEREVNDNSKRGDADTLITEIAPEVKISVDQVIKIVNSRIEGVPTLKRAEFVDNNLQQFPDEILCKPGELRMDPADGQPHYPGFKSNKTASSTDLIASCLDAAKYMESVLPGDPSTTSGTVDSENLEKTSYLMHVSPGTDFQRADIHYNPANLDTHRLSTATDTTVKFDTHRSSTNMDTAAAILGNANIPKMHLYEKTAPTGTSNSLISIQRPDIAASTGDFTPSKHHGEKYLCSHHPSCKYNCPLSESKICRNIISNSIPEIDSSVNGLDATESCQAIATCKSTSRLQSFAHESELESQNAIPNMLKGVLGSEGLLFDTAPLPSKNQEMVLWAGNGMHSIQDAGDFGPPIEYLKRHQMDIVNELAASDDLGDCSKAVSCILDKGSTSPVENADTWEDLSHSNSHLYRMPVNNECRNLTTHNHIEKTNRIEDDSYPKGAEASNELEGFVELVGCYIHPTQVLSVLLSTKGDDIHICVLCGLIEDNKKTLFIYRVPVKGLREKGPSFLGYTSIMLPLSKGTSDRETAFERSGLQFTPDGQCLVLLNSIKVPCCREQNICCLCSACLSNCFEGNAVKLVHVQLGYVTVLAKLTAAESIYCILVCEPYYLVAAVESGRLHVWIMNLTWSAKVEEFILPSFDYACPSILELRRMPSCASMVIGHNGIGGFGLWDISKRVLLSSFSCPRVSVFQVIPIGLFGWQMESLRNSSVDEHIKDIIAATEKQFSRTQKNNDLSPPNGEDSAVWLLVSAASNFEAQCDYPTRDLNANPVGWWRLALLVKDTLVMGNILDPRASAAVASGGHGLIGTCDGLVYMWELSTGKKVANLQGLKGGVSCVATDVRSGALAIAGSDCQVLLYIQSSDKFSKLMGQANVHPCKNM